MIGKSISHYRIIEKLGAGGMGEVFLAEDSHLNRRVAIKVLPDEFARDPERLARFDREAKLLASLSHANIAAIYGLEKTDGNLFLIMELVEGETLAQRVAKGPMPVDDVLEVCRQIAEGLEAAHEKGIIHRDLKPANIKITPEGKVKILDFGPAKAFQEESAATAISHSPTITEAMTRVGVILGTAAYMSPEQARGATVDKRADIWSFGVVLYEMLTGKQLFAGETVSDTLAAVLTREPEWEKVPAKVRSLLRRCLAKDPKCRLRDIGEAMVGVERAPESAPVKHPWLAWSVAVALLLALSLVSVLYFGQKAPAAAVTRLVIPLPEGQELTDSPAISPDGRIVAYAAKQGSEEQQLFLRDLNSFDAKPVAGTKGASQPFFSPDSRWVAFLARGQLMRAEVAGGSPTKIADAAGDYGGSWGDDNTIVFTAAFNSGLLRVPAVGGQPETVTKPDGAAAGYATYSRTFCPVVTIFSSPCGERTPPRYCRSIHTSGSACCRRAAHSMPLPVIFW